MTSGRADAPFRSLQLLDEDHTDRERREVPLVVAKHRALALSTLFDVDGDDAYASSDDVRNEEVTHPVVMTRSEDERGDLHDRFASSKISSCAASRW